MEQSGPQLFRRRCRREQRSGKERRSGGFSLKEGANRDLQQKKEGKWRAVLGDPGVCLRVQPLRDFGEPGRETKTSDLGEGKGKSFQKSTKAKNRKLFHRFEARIEMNNVRSRGRGGEPKKTQEQKLKKTLLYRCHSEIRRDENEGRKSWSEGRKGGSAGRERAGTRRVESKGGKEVPPISTKTGGDKRKKEQNAMRTPLRKNGEEEKGWKEARLQRISSKIYCVSPTVADGTFTGKESLSIGGECRTCLRD